MIMFLEENVSAEETKKCLSERMQTSFNQFIKEVTRVNDCHVQFSNHPLLQILEEIIGSHGFLKRSKTLIDLNYFCEWMIIWNL